MVNIIEKKYRDLNKFSLENTNNFLDAKPFPFYIRKERDLRMIL